MEGELSVGAVQAVQRYFSYLLLILHLTWSQQDARFQLSECVCARACAQVCVCVWVGGCVQASRTQGVRGLRRETEKMNVDEREVNTTRDARHGQHGTLREKGEKNPKL